MENNRIAEMNEYLDGVWKGCGWVDQEKIEQDIYYGNYSFTVEELLVYAVRTKGWHLDEGILRSPHFTRQVSDD